MPQKSTQFAPVFELLADLIRINSVNPSYEGGVSEAGIVRYLAEYFEQHGIETWQQEAFPGRPNLIARIPGRNPSRRLIFEGHTDTVSAGGMSIPPFDPVLSGGRIYGRGSCDTKAGLAAMAYAAVRLRQERVTPPSDIWVLAAADEEYSFGGVRRFLAETGRSKVERSGAVVAEPTGMRIAIASKGVLRWRIACHGKAAHSSKPHAGVNAIVNMARVIVDLEQDNTLLQAAPHPLLGPATLNVGLIEGGRQVNTVPDLCTIEIDRRLLPGESIPKVLAHYRDLLDPSLGAHFEPPLLEDEALETPYDSDLVRFAMGVASELGLDPAPIGVAFGSDASKFSRAGIPSIICGPGDIDLAHSAEESIELTQVEKAVTFYHNLMKTFV